MVAAWEDQLEKRPQKCRHRCNGDQREIVRNRTDTSMQPLVERLAVVTRSCSYSLFSTWPMEEVRAGWRRGR